VVAGGEGIGKSSNPGILGTIMGIDGILMEMLGIVGILGNKGKGGSLGIPGMEL
jgi:hypothetical protein